MTDTDKQIKRILETAYNEVPYFNHIINEIIQSTDEITPELFHRLPIFNKKTILEIGWENFVSGNYLDEEYRPRLKGIARIEKTSGTTGNPMGILWKNSDFFASNMNHWKYRSANYGISPNSRMCTSSKNIPGDDVYYIDPRSGKMTFSIKLLNEETIRRIIEKINEYEPEWLYIQNSILYVLVYFAEKYGLKFPSSIKYIEYIGEPLCEYYRKRIYDNIPCPSSDMYGCVETNGISYECREGHHHLLTDNVIVEIVDEDGNSIPDGECGYVCVTGLHNTAMPMLRYRLNDIAKITKNVECNCGNKNPIIDIKAGRMTEYLLLDDASVFPDAKLFCPINSGLQGFEPHSNDIVFNLKMNALDDYDINVYQNNCKDIDVADILTRLFAAYKLPNIRFTVSYVEAFDSSKPAGMLTFGGKR